MSKKEYRYWDCEQPKWHRIDNIKSFDLDEVKIFHPSDPRYISYWKEEKKRCIEGLWRKQFGKWMHMPGCLYFYGKFGIIVDTDKFTKVTKKIKPLIHDLEWEQAFYYWLARGFSGWLDDDEFTSDNLWFLLKEEGVPSVEELENMDPSRKAALLNVINSKGQLKKYKSPFDNLRELKDKPLGRPLFQNEARNKMTVGCHSKESKFRLFDGSTKFVNEIRVGDVLMGPDSNPRKVKEVLTGENVMVKITPKYGSSFKVTPSHLLRVKETDDKDSKIVREYDLPVWKYINLSENKKSYIELIDKNLINYPEKDLVLDPYFIGLWLGDGFKREKLICVNQEKDEEILSWLKEYCDSNSKLSYTITKSKNGLSDGYTTRFRLIHQDLLYKDNYWAKTFLNSKHIPKEYLINSLENRLKLLAGYIDSDGCYESKANRYTITSVDLKLLKQTEELVKSCGLRAIIHKSSNTGLTNSVKYNLRITGNIDTIPVKLSYKKATNTRVKSNRNRFTAKALPPEKFYGVEVDKDHLYMLENGLQDHNSRGGGKSFFEGEGVQLYNICFDGAIEYDPSNIQKIETCIGSGDTDKSGEIVQKIVDAMNEFALNPKLGVWGKQGDADWTPNPFFRDMSGPTGPGNKQKGGWQHKYKKKVQGRWVDGFGTGTKLFHVSYSSNKKSGAEAGAGGRYNVTTIEETGLTALVIEVYNSNIATVKRNGVQFGVQSFLGTSGNVELILPTKEMFTNPKQFNIVSFKNVWESPEDEIGFFLPAYMTYRQFKDKNGNTDIQKARAYWLEGYKESLNSNNPKTLRMYCMNYPDVPSHMWVSDKNYLLPYEEAVQREKELMQNQLFKSIGKAVSLRWDHTQPTKVTADIVHNPDPFYDFPIRSDKERIDGEIMIYKEPELVHGEVPNDMYLFTHDPYVSDDQEEGASLGVTYVFLSPKYASTHEADIIVASYIGKPEGGKKVYYENLEKLLAYYGNPIRGLNYEANRGEFCRSYFAKKGKVFLLMPRPQFTKGDSMQAKKVSQFGTIVGAHGSISKITMIDDTYDYLLEETTYNRETRRVIETIPCIFLLRQIQQFELKGNFDAVSALILYPTSRGELKHYILAQNKQKQTNKLSFLSTNKLVS